MNNLAKLRKDQFDQVLTLIANDKPDAALNILWDLRLKVDLSVYRRALVNLYIAALLQRPDRTKYAREGLDLLDLFRQKYAHHNGVEEELEHVSDLEDAGREILKTSSVFQSQPDSVADNMQVGPGEGVLPETVQEAKPLGPDPAIPESNKAVSDFTQDIDLRSLTPTAGRSAPLVHTEAGKTVWTSTPTPLITAPAGLPHVEGFLRDKYYKPYNDKTLVGGLTETDKP